MYRFSFSAVPLFALTLLLAGCIEGQLGNGSRSGGNSDFAERLEKATEARDKACGGYESTSSITNTCRRRTTGSRLGSVSKSSISESSAIAASSLVTNRLYQINDSGSSSTIYFSDHDGSNLSSFNVTGYTFRDVEDMDIGACPDTGTCLYIADTGNNALSTSDTIAKIVVIKELTDFGASVSPEDVIDVYFPATHKATQAEALDIESFAVHPTNQNFYFLTKGVTTSSTKYSQQYLFRIPSSAWVNADSPVELRRAGPVVFPTILLGHLCETVDDPLELLRQRPKLSDLADHTLDYSHPGAKLIATSMDFNDAGDVLAVLTYGGIWEFDFDDSDLASTIMRDRKAHNYRQSLLIHDIKSVPQAEALTYIPSSDSIIYTTEVPSSSSLSNSPIYEADCED